ncbi:phosphomannomutase/phosphoglucomutase, partial [Candidatus Uhrbacteria bacterium]|nr:phosphomannomutase/phosphoglucomutase [Candidatus Uhrbacteria bacterium]
MAIDPTIFRGYDVRARHEDQLTDEAVEATAFSYAAHTGAKRVAMGWDMRRSSPRIVSALTEGLLKAGVDVMHIGLCTTPMLYFAVGSDETIDGGLMVTASHCTTEMNGVKLCRADVQPIGFGSGMEDIRDRALRGERHHARRRGTLETRDVKPAFFDHLFSVAGDMDLSGMSVVFDAGNSVASVVLPEIIARLGVEHTDLYFDLDDTFPNHEANPVKTETMHDLRAMVRAKGAHVGFAYDGDADRIGVVDETGAIVSSDYVLLLLAQALLKKEAGALVLSDIGCTRDVERGVTQMGGRHLSTPVGHAHIKRMMHEHGGALAGEYSGHMYFREMFRAESTMLATLLLLNILRASGAPARRITTWTTRMPRCANWRRDLEVLAARACRISTDSRWIFLRGG